MQRWAPWLMLHHMALLADHANDRIRREMVFRNHNDLLVGYIKICNFMSDHFFFNSGTVRYCAPCYWQSSLLQQHVATHSAFCCWRSQSRDRRTKLLFGPPSHPQVSPLQPPWNFAFLLFSVLLPLFPTRHNTGIRVCFICRSHSWGHLHWPFMVKKGRVEGGTWSWFSCAQL